MSGWHAASHRLATCLGQDNLDAPPAQVLADTGYKAESLFEA